MEGACSSAADSSAAGLTSSVAGTACASLHEALAPFNSALSRRTMQMALYHTCVNAFAGQLSERAYSLISSPSAPQFPLPAP